MRVSAVCPCVLKRLAARDVGPLLRCCRSSAGWGNALDMSVLAKALERWLQRSIDCHDAV